MNAVLGLSQPVEFEEDQIGLDIPFPSGITTNDKAWRIIALGPPVVSHHVIIWQVAS